MGVNHSKVIILGAGPSGLTAGIYASRANLKPTLLTGSEIGGQIILTNKSDNYPGFPDGINGFELANLMKQQAEKFNVNFVLASAKNISKENNSFLITTTTDAQYSCDALIIACGCSKRLSNIKGENELFGYGVSTCATCDGMFYKNKVVAVIGGGNTACKDALYLADIASKVFIINPASELSSFPNLLEQTISNKNIKIFNNSSLNEIVGSKELGVKEIIISKDKTISSLACDGVFISTGFKPNSEIFSSLIELDSRGYIKTEPDSTKTSVNGIFACGDIRSGNIHQITTAVGTACLAVSEVEKYLKNF